MPIIERITEMHGEMTAWRRDLHAHPEIAFEETRTAAFVAEKLRAFGIEVSEGMAKTGVVGTLVNDDGASGAPSIGLRADMDALPMPEHTDLPYASTVPGKMHACGHDGHTTMLLGAAQYLAETRNFKGRVQFIFQPAEEMAGGGRVMVEEGLFEQFPVDAVYGMHNWPNMPAGRMSIRAGLGMASAAAFEIVVQGLGSHAAAPHQGIDPILIGAHIVTALQSISSRVTNPIEGIVVSVTQFHGGDAINALPDSVTLKGTARSFAEDSETSVAALIQRIAEGTAAAHGATVKFEYQHLYPVLVNAEDQSLIAENVVRDVLGDDGLEPAYPRTMASEDFSFMLNARPGCFVRIGAAFEGRASAPLHNSKYEFNDDVLPIGASFWARLVEMELPK
ncbi:MAG: amidohydrolase [Rhodospirillaceae bacterium]|jgi:hippurate hydrolase|nr:amidohydrolase [Rhodospirillaceae bacterium]MBT3886386.1 amidohydrolase [Rhodospirillaceae bacterium]MBT4118999.1 amidohydrolase [Rhodospirillaceae bacterium]MBT4674034.1 amidohydrolase [Rhodospirillaceae bacterium]MBT4719923.1 amidohydrolase [Rhodospirillaceae bacterium]